jgi:hypothetical protein
VNGIAFFKLPVHVLPAKKIAPVCAYTAHRLLLRPFMNNVLQFVNRDCVAACAGPAKGNRSTEALKALYNRCSSNHSLWAAVCC